MDGVLLERIGKNHGKPCFGLEFAFAKYGQVGGVLAEHEHWDKQRLEGNGPVCFLGTGKFAVLEFQGLLDALG